MGFIISKLRSWRERSIPRIKVLMLGLDNVGKTTLMLKIANGTQIEYSIPTPGLYIETLKTKNMLFSSWDIPSPTFPIVSISYRIMARHFYPDTQALIFVIDSNDFERFHVAKDELDRLLYEEDLLKDICLLVYVNKMDIGSISLDEVQEKLKLRNLTKQWKIQGIIGTKGEGMDEGLEWIIETVNRRNQV